MGMAMRMPLSMIVPMWLLSAVFVVVIVLFVAMFVLMPRLGLVSVLVPAVIVCHATHLTSLARPPA
jgi:hypothetical protein